MGSHRGWVENKTGLYMVENIKHKRGDALQETLKCHYFPYILNLNSKYLLYLLQRYDKSESQAASSLSIHLFALYLTL